MQIRILQPLGWCAGVKSAINNVHQIINKHHGSSIYLLGWLVHNKSIIEEIKRKRVTILHDNFQNKLALVKSIKSTNAVIVLPTHGTTKEVLTYVNKYFKYVYDLTCKKLCRNFQIVNDLIKKDYQIIYYGKRNHPETNVISSIAPNIIIVENQDDIKRIKFGHLKKYALINQSTFSENFTSKIKLLLSQRIKHLTYFNTTCPVTSFRQKHLEHLTKTELLLIIGDKSSNNANQLLSLAKEKKIKSKLISNINQIKTPLFTSIKRLTIITATSVSPLQVHQIINKIKTTKR